MTAGFLGELPRLVMERGAGCGRRGMHGKKPGHRRGDGCDQVVLGSGFGSAKQGFDFAPHLFDGIEIRGVSRKKADFGPSLPDQVERQFIFVRGKVVHDHHLPRPQGGTQDLTNISLEHFRVGGAVDGQASR